MLNGAAALNYGLYTDAGHTTNFATLASANGTGSGVVTTVYGQVAAGQYVAPGTYTDTVTATVTY
jgi:spore coat protein U-like protein